MIGAGSPTAGLLGRRTPRDWMPGVPRGFERAGRRGGARSGPDVGSRRRGRRTGPADPRGGTSREGGADAAGGERAGVLRPVRTGGIAAVSASRPSAAPALGRRVDLVAPIAEPPAGPATTSPYPPETPAEAEVAFWHPTDIERTWKCEKVNDFANTLPSSLEAFERRARRRFGTLAHVQCRVGCVRLRRRVGLSRMIKDTLTAVW
jgi:hypothetical protein